jgi:hypothetical protein
MGCGTAASPVELCQSQKMDGTDHDIFTSFFLLMSYALK